MWGVGCGDLLLLLLLLAGGGRGVGRGGGALVELGAEGGGFALETVAPVREAEAEAKVGEHRGEVVDGGDCARGGVCGSDLAFGEERGGEGWWIDLRWWREGVL